LEKSKKNLSINQNPKIDVFLPGRDPNAVKVEDPNKSFLYHAAPNVNPVKILVKIKNSSCKPLTPNQLQRIVENFVLNSLPKDQKTENQSTKIQNQVIAGQYSREEKICTKKILKQSQQLLLESTKELKLNKKALQEAILSSSTMLDEFQYSSIDFDQLLNDICNDTQLQSTNDDHLLDEVLQELSGSTFSGSEFSLTSDETPKTEMMDFPDLFAGLPMGELGDFPNLDLLLPEEMNNYSNINIEEIETNSEVLSPSSSSISELDDILCELSNSSSDELNFHESDFNNLVDNIFDSDFMKEFLDNDDANLPSTTEVSQLDAKDNSSPKCGFKRKPSESLDKVCDITTKSVKHNEKVLPSIAVKDNETEKEAVRRIKNNEASKVTRAKRKLKQGDLFKQENELLQCNAKLNMQIEVMQKEAEILRKVLVSKLSSINSS